MYGGSTDGDIHIHAALAAADVRIYDEYPTLGHAWLGVRSSDAPQSNPRTDRNMICGFGLRLWAGHFGESFLATDISFESS